MTGSGEKRVTATAGTDTLGTDTLGTVTLGTDTDTLGAVTFRSGTLGLSTPQPSQPSSSGISAKPSSQPNPGERR